MSLNKLTDSSIKKQWMNISCNDIKSDSLQIAGKDVITTAGNKNLDVTLTTTQTVFTQDQELVTKKYVDAGGGVPPNVLTTSGGQNITLTNTTSQTTFTQPQELITKAYADAQKPAYTSFLKNFSGEFYNDGIIILLWDGFDEIIMRLVNAKSNVYAQGLVNFGGSYPSGQTLLLSTLNDDFYQSAGTGQVEFIIYCDNDNTFPFYKCRFLVSGSSNSNYCYSIIEKFT